MKTSQQRGTIAHEVIGSDYKAGISNPVQDSIRAFGNDMEFEVQVQINPENSFSPVRDVDFISESNNVVGEIKTGVWTAQEQASAIAQVRANAFAFSKAHGNVSVTIVIIYSNGKSGKDSKPFTISAVQPFSVMSDDFAKNCPEQFAQEEIARMTNERNEFAKVKDFGTPAQCRIAAKGNREISKKIVKAQADMVAYKAAKDIAHRAAKRAVFSS